jgi:hypothetical protein
MNKNTVSVKLANIFIDINNSDMYVYVISPTCARYHAPACGILKNRANISGVTRKAARNAGKTPCLQCTPGV